MTNKVLALAISMLMPSVPVLADVATDQAAAVTAQTAASADQTALSLQSGTRGADTPVAGQTTLANASGQPPATPPSAQSYGAQVHGADVAAPPAGAAQKPSFLSGMKDSFGQVGNEFKRIVTKHPILTGAFIGAAIGIFGTPTFFVLAVAAGVLAGVALMHMISSSKHS